MAVHHALPSMTLGKHEVVSMPVWLHTVTHCDYVFMLAR